MAEQGSNKDILWWERVEDGVAETLLWERVEDGVQGHGGGKP